MDIFNALIRYEVGLLTETQMYAAMNLRRIAISRSWEILAFQQVVLHSEF
jgi:hypothetical protein